MVSETTRDSASYPSKTETVKVRQDDFTTVLNMCEVLTDKFLKGAKQRGITPVFRKQNRNVPTIPDAARVCIQGWDVDAYVDKLLNQAAGVA